MKKQDTYSEPKIFEFPGIVAKVYYPIISEEENNRRMEAVAKAAARLLQSERKK